MAFPKPTFSLPLSKMVKYLDIKVSPNIQALGSLSKIYVTCLEGTLSNSKSAPPAAIQLSMNRESIGPSVIYMWSCRFGDHLLVGGGLPQSRTLASTIGHAMARPCSSPLP